MNPTGSFKDRGMTVAVSAAKGKGAEAIICASTGNTAASAAAYAARAGMRGAVIVPEGKIARGKLAQALMHGARVIALRGNFDQALELVSRSSNASPIALVNSVNPYRIEGQKTAAFEVCDELGAAPDVLCDPGRQRGQRDRLVEGLRRVRPGRGRTCTASRPRAPRRSCSASRSRTRRRWRPRSGSATRRAGRRRWARSTSRAARSRRSPTTRSSTHTLARLARGRVLRAGLGRLRGRRAEVGAERALLVCVLTGHGLKDPQTALAAVEVTVCEPDFDAVERAVLG